MSSITLLYDGECPFCNQYGKYIAVRSKRDIELLDARLHSEMVGKLRGDGYDIDKGMILLIDGRTYHGGQAVVVLGALSYDMFWYDKLVRALVKLPGFTRVIYPIIKFIRQVTLTVLGRNTKINQHDADVMSRHLH